jgi:hypothetical protein
MGRLLTTFKDKTFEPSMKSYFKLYTDATTTASQIYDSLLYVRGTNAGSLLKNQEGDDDVSTVEAYDTYMPVRFHNIKSASDGNTPASSTHTFFNVYNRAEYNGPSGQNIYDLYGDYNSAKLSGAGYVTNTIGGGYNAGLDMGTGDSQTIAGVYGSLSWAEAKSSGSSRTVTYLMGSRGVSKVNSSSTTATFVYPHTSEFNLTAGTVGTVALHKLDFDYTAGNITNAYFIWADESSLPTPSGEKYFIKSNIPWPTLLSSSLTNTGAVTFQSTLSVSGTTTLSSNATVGGTLTVTGVATFNSDVSLQDNDKLKIGTGDDLQIYHDGSNSYIDGGAAVGNLIIRNRLASGDVIFQGDNGDGDGSQTTYFQLDNSIANTGNPDVYTRFPDNSRLTFGNSANANSLDLEIYHEGSASYIKNGTSDFNIESKGGIYITNDTADDITIEQKSNDSDIVFKCDNGSGGTTPYLTLDGGNAAPRVNFFVDVYFASGADSHPDALFLDQGILQWGTHGDLQIQHDGTDSTIVNIGNGVNGDLVIEQQEDNKDIIIKNDNGSGGTTAYITLDGDAVSTAISTIKVLMPNLPTSDPSVAGQLWNSSGDLKISAG